jgi:hypothetical protein
LSSHKNNFFDFSVFCEIITANGLRLGEGREFENRQPKLSTNVDSSTNVQLLPSALLLPNRCWRFVVFVNLIFIIRDNPFLLVV